MLSLMKTIFKVLVITALICIAAPFVSLAQSYDYMTVIQFKASLHISSTNNAFEIVSVKGDTKHQIDFSPILKKAAALQEEGWEVYDQQIDAAAYPSMTMWFRKEK